jgi:hypothetical protein
MSTQVIVIAPHDIAIRVLSNHVSQRNITLITPKITVHQNNDAAH